MITRRDFVGASLATTALLGGQKASTATTGLADMTLRQAGAALRNRSVSPTELTRTCLERIEAQNPRLNAFITVTAEQALARARQLENELARGHWRGPAEDSIRGNGA